MRSLNMEEIRLLRDSEIRKYINKKHNHRKYFSNDLSSTLYSIVEWINYRGDYWNKLYSEKVMELGVPLEGVERVIVAEIVPKFDNLRPTDSVSGKTIKISNYRDLNAEFLRTIAFSIDRKNIFNENLQKILRNIFVVTLKEEDMYLRMQ